MPKRKTDFDLPTLDDLFSTQEERDEAKLDKIRDTPLELIDDFPDHPFHVRDDEDMQQLVDSIKSRGVLTPAVLREKEDGRYELVSGHRRKRACELAGLSTLRSEIKDLSRDEAIIYMVESNFQRSSILPSEKAFSYKMRLEAMKRQGQRSDLTSVPVGQKLSREELSSQTGDPELLDLVDEGSIKMRPAVELSYLDYDYQKDVLEEIEVTQSTPSHAQTIRMRKMQDEGTLNTMAIREIMSEEKPNQKERIILRGDKVRKLIPKAVPIEQTEDYIYKAIEHYNKFLSKKRSERDSR